MRSTQHGSRAADAIALAVSLAVASAVFAVVRPASSLPDLALTAPATEQSEPARAAPGDPAGSARITMSARGQAAAATLEDTPVARQVAAMLPVTVDLHDRFGQAKSAALPGTVDVTGAPRQYRPVTGGIYYWPDAGGQIAVYYDAFDQEVPAPGLVRIGSVTTGLDALAARGRVTVTIRGGG
jgi:hypothetical protein